MALYCVEFYTTLSCKCLWHVMCRHIWHCHVEVYDTISSTNDPNNSDVCKIDKKVTCLILAIASISDFPNYHFINV